MSVSKTLPVVLLLSVCQLVWAADTPPTEQLPGEHSTICTSDGNIRDDELADYIASQIPKDAQGNPQVKDVKVFFNSCYGGGMLDDFGRVFGPGGAAAGVPWIGGSASAADECAWGPSDAAVGGSGAGSFWTDGLAGALSGGGNVGTALSGANAADSAGPGGSLGLPTPENPQAASGNGGDGISLSSPGTQHEVIVFGGSNNRQRHDNNISTMEDTFNDLWGADANIQTSATGTTSTQGLKDMISDACQNLNPDTQLVLYIDDHGDTEFDMDEYFDWLFGQTITVLPDTPWGMQFDLHPGWQQGLAAMDVQPLDVADPQLCITSAMPVMDGEWIILFNGQMLPVPMMFPGEEVQIPVDWMSILPDGNMIEILAEGLTAPLELLNLELWSGAINEIDWDALAPVPGDADGDGIVDLTDLGILATNWGRMDVMGPEFGDFDSSGGVDLSDLGILATNWGTGTEAVPEPATMSLLALGGAILLRRKR